jgi:hypothetical protein
LTLGTKFRFYDIEDVMDGEELKKRLIDLEE